MNLEQRRFLRAVGDRVRARRTELGYTQAALGRASGLDRTFVGSVERGERNVSVLNLRAIAGALRTTVAALVAEDAAP